MTRFCSLRVPVLVSLLQKDVQLFFQFLGSELVGVSHVGYLHCEGEGGYHDFKALGPTMPPDLLFYRGFVSTPSIPYFATVLYCDNWVLQISFHAPLPHCQGESRIPCWRAISSNSVARVFELFNR